MWNDYRQIFRTLCFRENSVIKNSQIRVADELHSLWAVRANPPYMERNIERTSMRICSYPDCGRPHHSRGYCQTHATQDRKGLTLTPIKNRRATRKNFKTPEEFKGWFFHQVKLQGAEDPWLPFPCALWQGYVKPKGGYGQLSYHDEPTLVHRLAWELYYGREIPEGYEVNHLCFNRTCMQPFHLEVVTPEENKQYSFRRNRQRKGEAINTSQLTTKDVLKIRKLLKEGRPAKVIAREYNNINPRAIFNIKHNRSWTHV